MNNNNDMNYDEITIEDCLEQYEYKNETVLLNEGKKGVLADHMNTGFARLKSTRKVDFKRN